MNNTILYGRISKDIECKYSQSGVARASFGLAVNRKYVREGEGKIFDKDGKSMLYEGHLRNGKRHGIGKSYRNRKLRYYGRWINDYPAWILYMSYIIGFLLCTTALVLNMFIGSIVVGTVLSLLILITYKKKRINS